jgi:hypothetical protein
MIVKVVKDCLIVTLFFFICLYLASYAGLLPNSPMHYIGVYYLLLVFTLVKRLFY